MRSVLRFHRFVRFVGGLSVSCRFDSYSGYVVHIVLRVVCDLLPLLCIELALCLTMFLYC